MKLAFNSSPINSVSNICNNSNAFKKYWILLHLYEYNLYINDDIEYQFNHMFIIHRGSE